ncbi:Zn-dependent exopeptidases superfamily protein [Wolffia australiana]
MRRRPQTSTTASEPTPVAQTVSTNGHRRQSIRRQPILFFSLFFLVVYGSWAVYHFQFEVLPKPLSPDQAGKRGFSEDLAMQHVIALTRPGPHPIGSDALDIAFEHVLESSRRIKESAHWEVDVEVDLFHARTGASRLTKGLFKGKTLLYSDLKHVVLRIKPKYLPEAEERAILVSSHIDTVFSTEGAGDCSSCIAVMLELARGMSQWAHGFKNSIIFLFNTGEEEGLNGAHSFIIQHPWRNTIRFFIDLEAMGIGGKSAIFQSGGDPWALEIFSRVAKYPSGLVMAQDLFVSGVIKSATDFQVYAEVGGLSGLDFAYADSSAVYHTKNDKLELLKPGSLQHLGENMLSFLVELGRSSHLQDDKGGERGASGQSIFFDVLGLFMVLYSQRFADLLHYSVVAQSLVIWTASIIMGGYAAGGAFILSFISIILMWVFSLSFSVIIAVVIPRICSSPAPYLANPWLTVGLFGAPAVLGALTGQSLGFLLLQKYLKRVWSKKRTTSPALQTELVGWESERWLFKAGFLQWLLALLLGSILKTGSSFLALVWLVSPAFAYGLIEATLTPARSPRPLRILTLLIGSAVPLVLSSGMIVRLVGTMTGLLVRFDRNPGGSPEWLGGATLAVLISALVCLVFVYFLSYIHLSDAKKPVVIGLLTLLCVTLASVATGTFPAYTDDVARAVNVVHVVESDGGDPATFVTLFSTTPGRLEREVKGFEGEDFACGRSRRLDFVTFHVDYACSSSTDSQQGWTRTEIPSLRVLADAVVDGVRSTRVSIDTKLSTRWSLAVNSHVVEDFTFRLPASEEQEEEAEELVPRHDKSSVDGRHIIQFSGGRDSPTKFEMELFWSKNETAESEGSPLLRLRTDVNRVTPKVRRALERLPSWCSLFGKSTSPYTLAFLTTLPVDFKL